MSTAWHFLYLSAAGLTAARTERTGLHLTGRFARPEGDGDGEPTAPAAADSFEAFLGRHRQDRFMMLVDVVDEELHLEQLPLVRGADLRRVVTRRLEQRFRGRQLTSWLPLERRHSPGTLLSRLRGARQAPQAMLAALGGEQALQPWLAVLQRLRVRVEGIQSPALLAARLAQRIAPQSTGLLVSLHPGGLRQTLLIAGEPRFTRLAAVEPEPSAERIRAECERTIHYLLMSQVVHRSQLNEGTFRIWIAGDQIAHLDALGAQIAIDNASSASIELLAPRAFGALPADSASGLAGASLWLQPSLWEGRTAGYAPAPIRRQAMLVARQRRALGTAVAALSVAILANLGVQFALSEGTHDSKLANASQAEQRERTRLQAEAARHPVSGSEMRQVVVLDAMLRSRSISARKLLSQVADALAADPSLKLRRISWARGELADTGSLAAPATMGAAPPALVAPPGIRPPTFGTTAPPPAIASEPSSRPLAQARITGEFAETTAMAEANQRVEAYATRLGEACGCDAKVRRLPYDPAPTLAFNASKSTSAKDAISFEIDLRWRAKDNLEIAGGPRGNGS